MTQLKRYTTVIDFEGYDNTICYLVKALEIIMGATRKEILSVLYKAAEDQCRFIEDAPCIKTMMSHFGFFRQPGRSGVCASKIFRNLEKDYGEGAIAIVYSERSQLFRHTSILIPSEDRAIVYADEYDDLSGEAACIWVRWPDGQDHSRKHLNNGGRTLKDRLPPADTDYYHYLNKNPRGYRIGDCVIRAIASALDISWHDALRELIRINNYAQPLLNTEEVYARLLAEKGFEQVKCSMTAQELCDTLNHSFDAGRRLVGGFNCRHVAAIVPINGRYKVEDTFDSSYLKLRKYWLSSK